MGAQALREVKTIAGLSRAFRRHVHAEVSVTQVWAGATAAWIAGATVPISGDCLVVVAPGVPHACNPVPGSGWRYTLALLDPGAWVPAAGAWRVAPSSERLRALFRALRDQGAGAVPEPEFLAALEAALAGAAPAAPGGAPERAPLERVLAHLRAHLGGPVALDDLARVAGLSKYHLVRAFRDQYGLTPHAYLLNLRVDAAKARLRGGQDPAGVALDAGFCDQSHFTRVFGACVGMTPAAYARAAAAIPSKTRSRDTP
jgi:AraC-like DNA-binding protein